MLWRNMLIKNNHIMTTKKTIKKTVSKKPCPGSKIRSGGKGRGLGIGRKKGPRGIPIGNK